MVEGAIDTKLAAEQDAARMRFVLLKEHPRVTRRA